MAGNARTIAIRPGPYLVLSELLDLEARLNVAIPREKAINRDPSL